MGVLARASGRIVALAALVLTSCVARPPSGEDPRPAPPLRPPDADRPAPARDQEPTGLSAERVRVEASKIMAELARARELEVTGEVGVDVLDKKGVREFAKKSIHEHTTPEEIRLLGRIQASLGVIPVGSDAEQIVLELLESGVLGLYDPKTKTLLVGNYVPTIVLSTVIGHELAHSLQDMHFGLERLQKPTPHQSDVDSARRFLVEGGAQAAYLAWISGEQGLAAIDDEVFDAMGNQVLDLAAISPYPILARDLQLPYGDGTATIARLVRLRGWSAVDKLYQDLPETSEQMLHIDKLTRREQAVPVTVDANVLLELLPGHAKVWHDTLGEASLLAMLAEVEPSIVARRAAAGWGGDRFVAIDREGSPAEAPLVVGLIAWDTARDAVEFERSFAKYLDAQVGEDHILARKRNRVLFAVRVPKGVEHAELVASGWRAAQVGKTRRKPRS